MADKKLFPHAGKMVPGEQIEFEAAVEPFTQYTLADGSLAKVKTVLLQVVRLEGEYTDQGEPVYQFQFQQIIGVLAPPELKRKVQ